ncbi:cytidylyltransferase domain-containing protein [Campylobacter hyointestinalis]|uniref:cytidylyltransferase domain-containing protein n=2 Tax=Campylobacter hyointestinalis TaxID=198 RepID=UPI0007245B4D|nr:Gfo/Idh/MocA family oxidoreductase [Campylobacter hyointestinalis]CUU67833.1 N-acylneuraminate cytidylyltransferase [Campylobacter hyointestinalis subsp. hyointestinalis]
MSLKVLIIGYGSIGRRHEEIMLKFTKHIDIVTSQILATKTTFKTLEAVKNISKYDYFIIASPTNKHLSQLIFLDKAVKNKIIFCEKPLFDRYLDINLTNNQIYVGYVLRYHPIFALLKDKLKSRIYFVEVSCGSYLPQWRINIDYKDSYSAKKHSGGGVLLDLSHEIDYVEWIFGDIIDVVGVNSKISELEIDSDDMLSIVARTSKNIFVNLTINYFSKISKRDIVIHCDNCSIKIDLIHNTMQTNYILKNDEISLNVERNDLFFAMHESIINGKNILLPTFQEALYTLNTIERMKNMKIKQNILCTIGCRGGSKGVKNKNIREIAGKPLLAHTILQALKTNLFSHVVLTTDSKEIAEVGQKWGAEVFFLRDPKMADDAAGKLPAIRDALLKSEEHFGMKFDTVIDLDATSPLRLVDDIINAYEQFLKDDNDILITASPARRSPYFNLVEIFKKDEKEIIDLSKKPQNPILRRQDSPKCYDMNASIYIWKRDVLLNEDFLFLEKTGLYIMPEERSIDIDSELDFKFVEFLMKENISMTQVRGGVN